MVFCLAYSDIDRGVVKLNLLWGKGEGLPIDFWAFLRNTYSTILTFVMKLEPISVKHKNILFAKSLMLYWTTNTFLTNSKNRQQEKLYRVLYVNVLISEEFLTWNMEEEKTSIWGTVKTWQHSLMAESRPARLTTANHLSEVETCYSTRFINIFLHRADRS